MNVSYLVVAALAMSSGLANAASGFPSVLNAGENTLIVDAPLGTYFEEAITFTLGEPSSVSGSLSALVGSISLLELRFQSFSEANDTPLVSITPINSGGVATFALGQLWAPTEPGIESGLYTLFLSGLKPANTSALNLSLTVSPIPEPSSYGLLGLGMAGIAFVCGRRTKEMAAA